MTSLQYISIIKIRKHLKLRRLLLLLFIFVLINTASAQSVTYGNGWQKICYSDGKCAYSNHPTYLRWDNVWIPAEWLNISNGNWSYKVEDVGTKLNFTADSRTISIPKANTNFNLQLFKISPSLTYSKTALVNNMVNVNATVAYLVFPYSLSQIRDYADEYNIKLGRWMFRAGQEHIDIHDDVVVNHTIFNEMGQNETYQAVTTLDKQYYVFKIINDEIRIYFMKAEANKLNGNITFALNSWSVGEGGNAWTGNSSFSNFMLDRNTNHITLPNAVTDGLVLYHKMSGSSETISYDMNLSSNNNGTLTNMNTGLDNGSSGWNSSGMFGNALSFDGVNDYVDAGNGASLNFERTDIFSMSLWIKSGSTNTYLTLLSKMDKSSPYPGYELNLIDGRIVMYLINQYTLANYIQISGLDAVNNNIWHNVVVTYNGSSSASGIGLYVDGLQKTYTIVKDNLSGTIIVPKSFEIGIREKTSYPYNGLIDNVQIYNRALTNDEINQTMNNTMLTVSNLTTWYNAGTGNETYQIDVNATTPTNTNYTVWYANNGTGSYTQLGGTLTGNNSLTISGTKYQNTDVQVRLAGNTTSTPELMAVTFWTQTASAGNSIPPTPIINSTITGNFYINTTWSAGSGNVTDSYNSTNGTTWINNTLTYRNTTLSPHAWQNLTIYAYNSSGNGTLNTTALTNNTQIPNNIPVLGSIGNKNAYEMDWLNFTLSAVDVDNDTLTYGTNASKGTLNNTTGNFNYSVQVGDVGIYTWYFNVSDAYNGVGNETITMTILEPPSYTVSGYVFDNNNISLSGVSVINGNYSAASNSTGYYNMSVLNGTYNFSYSKTNFNTGYLEVNINGTANTTANKTILNTLPPASITNISSSATSGEITWTWTNPTDSDFNYTSIYLDGVFKTNTSTTNYTASSLTVSTSYTISTRTVDTYGNMNTSWVNNTAATTEPTPSGSGKSTGSSFIPYIPSTPEPTPILSIISPTITETTETIPDGKQIEEKSEINKDIILKGLIFILVICLFGAILLTPAREKEEDEDEENKKYRVRKTAINYKSPSPKVSKPDDKLYRVRKVEEDPKGGRVKISNTPKPKKPKK